MFGLYFTNKEKLRSYTDIKKSNLKVFIDFHRYMLQKGIFFAPSIYEAGFISASHTRKHLDHTQKSFGQNIYILPE